MSQPLSVALTTEPAPTKPEASRAELKSVLGGASRPSSEALSVAQQQVIDGALAMLSTATRQLEAAGDDLERTTKTKLLSRLQQASAALERVGQGKLDPAAKEAIAQVVERLDAHGGKLSLSSIAAKLRGLLGIAGPADLTDVAKSKLITRHIKEAQRAYARGDYKTAHHLLTNSELASKLGLSLNIQNALLREDPALAPKEELDSLVMQMRMMSMSYQSGKVDLCTGCVILPEGKGCLELHEIPVLAKQLLPIMLEEWMHQQQRLTGRPVSKLTEEYMAANGAPWEGLHEMDIQASFREWGFPTEELGTVHAYKERGDFERWYQSKRSKKP
jgi:hypothetical protein